MTVTRHASFMAKSMGKDPVEIVFTKGGSQDSPVHSYTLVSGTYELTAESYDASAGMKMAADIIVDAEAKTFELWRTMSSGEYSKRSEGSISFDEKTGVYTISFTTPAEKSTEFTFDAEKKGITFTSPLYFGAVAMNVTDDNGAFLPYTAYPKAVSETFEDALASGTYELTAESYDASAGMKMAADIIVDAEAKTFELWRTMSSGEYSKRSEGSITFDEKTGVYTISFTTPADKSTEFTFDAEKKGITFTSPLYFGAVAMNVTDDNGAFLPYTAYPKAGDKQPSDFKEGTYTGTFEKEAMSGVGIKYTISAAFSDGKYSYDVHVQLTNGEYDNDDSTKYGSYTVEENKLVFDGGNLVSAEITGEGKLKIYGTLSSFAFAPDYADIVWTSDEKPSADDSGKQDGEVTYKFTEGAKGDYALGSNKDYTLVCEGPFADFVEVRFDGVKLDSADYTVSEGSTKGVISGKYLGTLSAGKHRIVFVYKNGTSEESVIRVAAADGTYADELKSGKYELKLDDFSDRAGVHRHPCIITVDAEGKTFIIHDTGDEVTNKGSGTFSFDSATGEYTMTYTAGGPETQADPTSTFVFKNNSLVFTSPLKIGRSMMNTRDDNGAFISYTAKLTGGEGQKPVADPKTGDGFDPTLWMALLIISAVSIFGLSVCAKKTARNK